MSPATEIDWGKTITLALAVAGALATLWKAVHPIKMLARLVRHFASWLLFEVLSDDVRVRKRLLILFKPEIDKNEKFVTMISAKVDEMEQEIVQNRKELQVAVSAYGDKLTQVSDELARVNRTMQTMVALQLGDKGLREALMDRYYNER